MLSDVQLGDPILVRSIYRGNVRWTFPHRYVGMWRDRYGLYCQPGNEGRLVKQSLGDEAASYLRVWVSDAAPFDWVWQRTHMLRFMRPGDAHTVELY